MTCYGSFKIFFFTIAFKHDKSIKPSYSNLTFYSLYPQCLTQAAISSGETFDKIECIAVIKVSTVRAFNFLKPALR